MGSTVSLHLPVAPNATIDAHKAFLLANSEAYERIVAKIQVVDLRKETEALLGGVAFAARFAGQFHPGRFADGAIENLALEVGEDLEKLVNDNGGFGLPIARQESRRRVLHVASNVLEIGGHTRMLYHWVRSDQSSCHSLVLVDQRDVPVPQWLYEAVRSSGGDLVTLPQRSSLCQKAKWLRETAKRIADLVVLHHAAFDVVPVVAFAVHGCPPVAVLNHADHTFWLGSSVSDMVINLRTAGSEHTAKRRFVSCNMVLPIPLPDLGNPKPRRYARRALGIPEDQGVLLSVGRAEKYRPCGSYDFVATAGKILDRLPGAHLYVVGESPAGIAPYLRCVAHERLHFVGIMQDLSLYHASADVYLESFPFGSQTALLEAALSGLPVVPAYAPLFPLLVANDDAIQTLISNPNSEQEYIERVVLLTQESSIRKKLGGALRKRLLVDHIGEGWLGRLSAVYQETDRLTHRPRQIPVSPCGTTGADTSLSLWRVMADGMTSFSDIPKDTFGAVLRHKAYVAKDVGDYTTARRCAWRAVRHDPLRWASWRLFAVAALGRTGRTIKLALRRA